MPSKHKRTGSESGALEFFRGGKAIPEALVRRHIADVREKRKALFERTTSTKRQMTKYLSQIQSLSGPDPSDPQTAKALDALLGLHKKLASQKLAFPKIPIGLGGILPGRISATVVPPFDYDVTIPTVIEGEPTLTLSADKNTGQMSVSCVTSVQNESNSGSAYATVGIYFHPMTAGTLIVSANPTYSFQWWTNSLNSGASVRSFGSTGLTIYGVDVAAEVTGGTGTIVSVAGQSLFTWDEDQTGQVDLDFGSDLHTPVSTQIEVNPTLVYLLFVEADTHVEGVGWPGSLAGAVISVTVPSITYEFEAREVFAP